MKTCSKCGEEKPFSEFHKRAASSDGYRGVCALCINSARDKEKISADNRMRRAQPEYAARQKKLHAKWRAKNRKRIQEYQARENISESRKAKIAANCRKRQAAKLQRTPSWANDQLIQAYYLEAKRLEELTGIEFHVDHIIPLQGELVSGLHVETNLQLLPAHENLGKSNSFDPQTFCA